MATTENKYTIVIYLNPKLLMTFQIHNKIGYVFLIIRKKKL